MLRGLIMFTENAVLPFLFSFFGNVSIVSTHGLYGVINIYMRKLEIGTYVTDLKWNWYLPNHSTVYCLWKFDVFLWFNTITKLRGYCTI